MDQESTDCVFRWKQSFHVESTFGFSEAQDGAHVRGGAARYNWSPIPWLESVNRRTFRTSIRNTYSTHMPSLSGLGLHWQAQGSGDTK